MEERAAAFFARLAERTTDDAVRRAALELRDEEREHVALVQSWLDNTPPPDTGWDDDPDPPRYTD